MIYVTVFWKTDLMVTNTEIHFLPIDESHTHALSRETRLDGQVYFYRRLFSNALKPRGCLLWSVWSLRGINNAAWGAKLILTAKFPCELCQSGSPTDGTALPFVFAHPTPSRPPIPIDSIRDITAVEKTTSKTRG